MIYYQITYTDSRTGERKTYMNVGFETRGEAERERKLLIAEVKKYRKMYIGESTIARASIVGKNFRIKKTIGRKHPQT